MANIHGNDYKNNSNYASKGTIIIYLSASGFIMFGSHLLFWW